MPNLRNKVCVVTGATKGIGRGVAVQLGQAGATVYITGRTQSQLDEVVAEIGKRGGKGIGVQVDHSDDQSVANLFERVKKESAGNLDVLVNNAFAGVETISANIGKKFFSIDDPGRHWDAINGVGLRNHFLCSTYAARIMDERGMGGLIVNISSPGGLKYLFNVAYGVGKAGKDRMAADMAVELRSAGVSVISLWPGAVKTEKIATQMENGVALKEFYNAETVEFAGMAIANIASDQPEHVLK